MKTGPTNPVLAETIDRLRKTKRKTLIAVADKLESATRRRPEVNLWKIDKYSGEGDMVVVPGKVLSEGELTHKITIAAFNFSSKALAKLKGKAKIVELEDLAKEKGKIKVIS
jgi:large subunit ribosomal protein L18e